MNIFGIEVADQTVFMIGLAIIGVLIVLIIKGRKKAETYAKKDIDVEAPQEFSDLMKDTGEKIFSAKFDLMNGPIKLGRITAFSPIHFDSRLSLASNLKTMGTKKEIKALVDQVKGLGMDPTEMMDNFTLFEVIKDNPINKILFLFGIGKIYHLVDQKFITQGYKSFNVDLYARPFKYYKSIYVYSEASKQVALNIADKLTVKQVCNGVINFIPKMEYIEGRAALFASKAREASDIKDTSWKKREQNLNPDDEPSI